MTKSVYNNLNQRTSQQAGGPMQFKGHLNKPSKVTISNGTTTVPATVDANNVFQGSVDVVPGNNTVTIVATDYSGNNNTSTNRYQVVVAAGVDRGFTYDANGNLANDGKYSYEWNARNECVAINEIGGTHRTEFTYDGLGRMVRLVEKDGATVTRDSHFVWVGTEMTEERDANGNVLKRFYDWGFQSFNIQLSTFNSFYYIRDHLGSIREVIDSNGNVVARYDYDLWGKRTLVSGTNLADFGFTGYYHYQPSWMPEAHLLAMYRIYRPDLAQWISNDLLEFEDPLNNERRYVRGNPINYTDPLGLLSCDELKAKIQSRTQDIRSAIQQFSDIAVEFAIAQSLNTLQGFGNAGTIVTAGVGTGGALAINAARTAPAVITSGTVPVAVSNGAGLAGVGTSAARGVIGQAAAARAAGAIGVAGEVGGSKVLGGLLGATAIGGAILQPAGTAGDAIRELGNAQSQDLLNTIGAEQNVLRSLRDEYNSKCKCK